MNKKIFLVLCVSTAISSQEIVDDAIDFQVDASNLSVDAQKKVEDLEEK